MAVITNSLQQIGVGDTVRTLDGDIGMVISGAYVEDSDTWVYMVMLEDAVTGRVYNVSDLKVVTLEQVEAEWATTDSYVEQQARAWAAELGLEVAPMIAKGTCEKCGKPDRVLSNTGSNEFPYYECGTCIHREARRQNTREMHGHGRQGY